MDYDDRLKSVSSRAPVNIALLKYWGKKDEQLNIPFQSSISMTLDELYTDTTIELIPHANHDELFINGSQVMGAEQVKISRYLSTFRQVYKRQGYVRIHSVNHVPTGAGLASSASAYASIAVALNHLFQLGLDEKGLSRLARLGSGSAARSIHGGIVLWHHGEDHHSSFAEQLDDSWDDLRLIVVLISDKKKPISSRQAMQLSVKTPVYQQFVTWSAKMLPLMIEAIKAHDIITLGQLVEESSERLHATIRASGVDYYQKETYDFLAKLNTLKKQFPLFYTLDAGPNVKLLTTAQYLDDVLKNLRDETTIVCRMGKEAYVKH